MVFFHSFFFFFFSKWFKFYFIFKLYIFILFNDRLNGREFSWTPGVGDGQGSLACCNSWGRKESDTTERLNWTELNSPLYGLAKKFVQVCLYHLTDDLNELFGQPYIHHIFFIHSSVIRHLGCFCVLAVVNTAATNTAVHVFSWIIVFSGYMLRSGIAGSYGNYIFSFENINVWVICIQEVFLEFRFLFIVLLLLTFPIWRSFSLIGKMVKFESLMFSPPPPPPPPPLCSFSPSSSFIIICSHYTIWTKSWDCPYSSICSNSYAF